ncbi:MAG: sugar phosphate isomerase/epimerase family protein [Planctomycetota bacterium]
MIRSAVTISLVEQARRGPFVFHGDLPGGCRAAAELGFDAVEIFAPSASVVRGAALRSLLEFHGLTLAALGTGAGMLVEGLHLCDADPDRRGRAEEFIGEMLRVGSEFGAPAIIGSMQGRWTETMPRPEALRILGEALGRLGELAGRLGTVVLYEPLNRYETNLCNTMREAAEFLGGVGTQNVKILADLFHLNIEEASIEGGLRDTAGFLGHVHFVDSNRQAAGRGHMNLQQVGVVLREMGYGGFASAEAFPIPDSWTAAEQTIRTFRSVFGGSAIG